MSPLSENNNHYNSHTLPDAEPPQLLDSLRTSANYFKSSVSDFASALALAVIWPMDFESRNPEPKDINPDQPLRIAVHGFSGSSNNWIYHLNRFKEAGLDNFATINLGHPMHSMGDFAKNLHNMVVDYKKGMIRAGKLRKGQKLKVQFISHSMGGLVVREYNQRYAEKDGVNVLDICTLGTPLDGTKIAYLAFASKSGRAMLPSSKYVKHQQKRAVGSNIKTRYLHIASKSDTFIYPSKSAIMGGAPKERTKVVWLEATGHIAFLFSDTVSHTMVDYFKEHNTSVIHK
jgi:triacylglycerol lipase